MTLTYPERLRTLYARPDDASAESFDEFCRENPELRVEQTAQGEWIIMAPTGGMTGNRNNEIARQLGNWARQDGTGAAFDSSTGFVMPNGARRAPDAAWVRRSRLASLTPEQKQRFLPICPDFVVELRSPSDSISEIQAKMSEYQANGAALGWLIDAAEQRVHVYRPGSDIIVHEAPIEISAGPEMPGFVLELGFIWEPDI